MNILFAEAQPDSLVPNLFKGIHFKSLNEIPLLLGNLIEILLIIIGILTVIYIMYGAIQYIMSGGESSKVAAAKTSITNAIIGLVLASVAYLIVNFIGRQFS